MRDVVPVRIAGVTDKPGKTGCTATNDEWELHRIVSGWPANVCYWHAEATAEFCSNGNCYTYTMEVDLTIECVGNEVRVWGGIKTSDADTATFYKLIIVDDGTIDCRDIGELPLVGDDEYDCEFSSATFEVL